MMSVLQARANAARSRATAESVIDDDARVRQGLIDEMVHTEAQVLHRLLLAMEHEHAMRAQLAARKAEEERVAQAARDRQAAAHAELLEVIAPRSPPVSDIVKSGECVCRMLS